MTLDQGKLELEKITNNISSMNSQIAALTTEKKSAPASEQLSYTTQIQELQMEIKQEGEEILVNRPNDLKKMRSLHGLTRTLIHNMVIGVTEGYTKVLELVGVGYRVSNQGNIIEFALGYTHPIFIQLPKEIKVETKSERNQNPILTLESCDKQLLGLVCAKIRSFRKPEPYKGKGILFKGEVIRRKSGKSASAK